MEQHRDIRSFRFLRLDCFQNQRVFVQNLKNSFARSRSGEVYRDVHEAGDRGVDRAQDFCEKVIPGCSRYCRVKGDIVFSCDMSC